MPEKISMQLNFISQVHVKKKVTYFFWWVGWIHDRAQNHEVVLI